MPKEFTFTPKFKLIVDHLKAVRTLNEYVNGAGLKKDMQDFANYLKQDLSPGILRPAGWKNLETRKDCLYSSPLGTDTRNDLLPKWRVLEDDFIAIRISPAWPVRDDNGPLYESTVDLYVPENWNERHQFIAKLEPPLGFERASQYSDGEIDETTPVFRYVRYESHVGPDGFDAAGFIEAFREATKALVAMEKNIDQILESLP